MAKKPLSLLLAAVLLHCGADSEPGSRPQLQVVVGLDDACSSSLRRVRLERVDGGEARVLREVLVDGDDLPFSISLDPPSGDERHTIRATYYSTASGAKSDAVLARSQYNIPPGLTGRLVLSPPCVCLGSPCPDDAICVESPRGSGKISCSEISTCGDARCDEAESSESCPSDCAQASGGSAGKGGAGQAGKGPSGGGAGQGGAGQGGAGQGGAGQGGAGQAGGGLAGGGLAGGGLAGGGASGSSGQGSEGGQTGAAGGPGGQGGSVEPDPCAALAPSGDGKANREAIQGCLAGSGQATLVAGEFLLDAGFSMPAGSKLAGAGAGATRLKLAGAQGVNHVLSVEGGSKLSGLTLDANAALPSGANEAVLHVAGASNAVQGVELTSSATLAAGQRVVGAYVIDAGASGNVLEGLDISKVFYGAIFAAGLDKAHENAIQGSKIHEIKCDGVTFAGYGRLASSEVWACGYDCENGPIPGASVYGLNNAAGALIENNHLWDDCGNIVDLDSVESFVLTGNTIEKPGYQWEGFAPWCGGGSAVAVVDSSHLVISGNTILNEGRPQNRMQSDPNGVFSPDGSGSCGDLPQGKSQVIALWIGRRRGGGKPAVGNSVEGNTIRGSCDGDCVGLAYFTSRGTGVDGAGNWSAETTSYFKKNNPFGSNVGSKRCGQNWYAANSKCAEPPEADCNVDDAQHDPPVGDWARNDQCYSYQ